MTTLNQLYPGERVGNYTLIRKIGQGGLGEVWLANHSKLSHKPVVAIKFVLEPRASELKRFEREVEILDMLRTNSHIIKAEDYGLHEGKPYLVMEYAPGGDLQTLADRKLSMTEIAGILEQAADALDFVHSKGVVHRDLKPSNLLFGINDHLLLADFGIAHEDNFELTETGLALGTLEYMAPEQFTDAKHVTAAADIYSLGVILFWLVSGSLPYGKRSEGRTPYQLMHAHCTAPIPDLTSLAPQLPPVYQPIIEKALAKNPAARYATAGQLAAAFRATQNASEIMTSGSLSRTAQEPLMPNQQPPTLPISSEQVDMTLPVSGPLSGSTAPATPAAWTGQPNVAPVSQPISQPSVPPISQPLSNPPSGQPWNTPATPTGWPSQPIVVMEAPKKSGFGWSGMVLLAAVIFALSVILLLGIVLVLPRLNQNNSNQPQPGAGQPFTPPPGGSFPPGGGPGQNGNPPNGAKVRVPPLVGKTLPEAQQILRDNRLRLGDVLVDINGKAPAGTVIATNPAADTEVNPDTPINIVVSRNR